MGGGSRWRRVLHPVLSPTGNPDRPRDQLRRRPVRPCPTPMCRRRPTAVFPATMRGSRRAFGSSFALLPEGGVVPDGRARFAAVPHLSERSCGATGFTVFLKKDSINRGKEAPVFGSQDPLFLNPSFPKTQVTESQISSWVGDDQRIPGVVCFWCFCSSLPVRGSSTRWCKTFKIRLSGT